MDGLPPTGKQLEVIGVNIYRVVDGRIVAERIVNDSFSLWQQLGVVPTLEELIAQAKSK